MIEGGYTSGINIIDEDPKFTYGSIHPFELESCSPAIEAGDNSFNDTEIDFAGNPRFYDAIDDSSEPTIDIGAYEFQASYTEECPCIDELVLTGLIDGGTYEASISITCDGTIEAGSDVIFNAPTINLNEDFEIEDTATLETLLTGCGSN